MLITSKYDMLTGEEMEIWSELIKYHVAINEGVIREILSAAYKYGVDESVWCLRTGSPEGNSFEDHIKSLVNGEYVVIEELFTQERHILTLQGLVNGIRLHMEQYEDIQKWLLNNIIFHKKRKGWSLLNGLGTMPKICDEVLQLAVLGSVRYK